MTTRMWTITIMITVTVLLIAWDIYAALMPGKSTTISRIIWEVSTNHPILPFAFGALMGHFFWPN